MLQETEDDGVEFPLFAQEPEGNERAPTPTRSPGLSYSRDSILPPAQSAEPDSTATATSVSCFVIYINF